MAAAKVPVEVPQMPTAPWPPTTISPPALDEHPRIGRFTAPKWTLAGWLPELRLVEWDLLDHHREAHREAQSAYENRCGEVGRGEAERPAAIEALRELRRVAEVAVAEIQAADAAAPAHESFAAARERLTPAAGGATGGMTPVPLSQVNVGADREAERHRAFFASHAEEREALRADHQTLVFLLGPSLNVVVPEDVALLLADPEPESAPGRAPGEPAADFAEREAEAP